MGFCDRERRGRGREDGRRTWERERAETPRNETEKMRGRRKGGGGWNAGRTAMLRIGTKRVEAAAGCASATWRGSARHWNCKCALWIFPYRGSNTSLSLSLSPPSPGLLPRFSLFLLPLAFLPPLALFELSPFHSLHRFIFSLSLSLSLFLRVSFYLSHISISVFVLLSHLFLPSHIARRFFSPSRALFFSRIFSLSFFISQKRKRTRKSVDSRSHFLVFHSCLFLWHSHFVRGLFTFLVLSPSLFPLLPVSFLSSISRFVHPLFHSSLIFPFLFYIWLVPFFSYPCKYTFVFSLHASCYEHYHLEAASDSRTVNLGYSPSLHYLHRLYLSSSRVFSRTCLSLLTRIYDNEILCNLIIF